jgi:transposase-like protein
MKAEEFRALTAELEELTPHQRNLLTERLQEIGQVKAVHTLIESRALAVPVCPKCGHDEIARWGSASGLQRYRCAACKATFNALTGTPLARLRHKDKWLDYAQQMAEGKSVRKSAKACDVHRNTAFRWRHRFLTLPDQQKATSLVGIAEADETFFLESFKGKKQGLARAPRKRGGKASKRGVSDEQIPVLICPLLERWASPIARSTWRRAFGSSPRSITYRMSMPTTVGSRLGYDVSTAWLPIILPAISVGADWSIKVITSSRPSHSCPPRWE